MATGPRARLGGRHLADLARVGDVGDPASGGSPAATASRNGFFAAADHGHGGAGAGQRGGHRAADAASAAGDESMLAVERHCLPPAGRELAGPAIYFSLKFQSFKLVGVIFQA